MSETTEVTEEVKETGKMIYSHNDGASSFTVKASCTESNWWVVAAQILYVAS